MGISRNGNLYRGLSAARRNAVRVRKRLRNVHPTAYVHASASVSRDLVAEEWVFVGAQVHLDPLVSIGRYTMLAPEVCVVGDDHIIDVAGVPAQFTGRPPQQRTVIGRDVWIGRGALVRRGVTIGNGAVIGARAVVTSDVPPYSVVVGVPGKVIRRRFEGDDVARHEVMLNGPVVPRLVAESLERSAGA